MVVRRRKVRRILSRSKLMTSALPFVGKLDAPIFMVLDPMVGNLGAKQPLSKSQMEWFASRVSKNSGFKKSEVCIISCSTPIDKDTWGQNKLLSAHLKDWREELLNIIKVNRPKFIIPFGAKACQQIVGRAVQITKVRGQAFQEKEIVHGIPVLPMLSPFFAQRQPENEATFVADLQTAGRIYRADFDIDASAIDYKHNYRWCNDLSFLLKNKPKRLSVDVETRGLYPFDPKTRLLTVQICWKPGEVVVVPIDYDRDDLRHHNFIDWGVYKYTKIVSQLRQLLEDKDIEIIGQNFKFDWLMLYYKLGIKVANYAHDTMLLAHLLDENQKKMNIDDLVRQHVVEMAGFNDALNNDPDHHGKSRMDLLPPDKMLTYSCGDADAALRLLDELHSKVSKDSKLLTCYNHVTMPAQRAFCWIELNGFAVSHDQLYQFQDKLKFIQKRDRIWLLRQIPKEIKDKWRDSGVGIKVTRAAILRDWLYEHPKGMRLKPLVLTKTKLPSISSKDVLPYYVTHPKYGRIITKLIDYIKNDKLLNTYAKGFHKYIFDDLIRPSYGLTGTTTGRCQTAETKITTTKGVIPLGDIVSRFECGEEFSVVTHKNRFQKVYNVFRNGKKTVYEIELANGAKTRATSNHPLMTRNGWTDVTDLSVGDDLHTINQITYETINEEWLIVEGWPDYQISNLGRVRYSGYKTTKKHRLVKPHKKSKWGHVKVRLSDRLNGRILDGPVHRLVCAAFNGPPPTPQHEVMHLDGLPANNDYRNLAWGTSQENSELMKAHGRSRVGDRSNQATLTWNEVNEIRNRYASGRVSHTELAFEYRVSRRLVGMVVNYERWKQDPTTYHKIVGIKRIGVRQTFDISVEYDHSFVADGIVSHNSMSRSPNGQNFPKRGGLAKEYRKVFTAPKGWVYMSCDLSQAELRIAAMMSGDPNMLKVYAEGGDIHRTTAAGTMGITLQEFLQLPKDVQDLKRFQAKAVNFGFLYGMWWVKFRAYAKTDYGIDFTEEEAKEIRENFFRTYPMLEVWHHDVMDYVFRKGIIRTYDGRIRHLPMVRSPDEAVAKMAQRQAINSPVQSIASDLGLMTLGRLLPYIRAKGIDKWLKPCGFIHDAIVCLVREDKVAHGCDIVKRFMENNPLEKWFGWTPEIPILADAEIGRTLAETIELKENQFVGKSNRHKSYDDLVAEILEKEAIKASTSSSQKRKITIKRGLHNHAHKKATTQNSSNGSTRVRKAGRVKPRLHKRGKQTEDQAT